VGWKLQKVGTGLCAQRILFGTIGVIGVLGRLTRIGAASTTKYAKQLRRNCVRKCGALAFVGRLILPQLSGGRCCGAFLSAYLLHASSLIALKPRSTGNIWRIGSTETKPRRGVWRSPRHHKIYGFDPLGVSLPPECHGCQRSQIICSPAVKC
jgi:hypothetical protein